jgi:protein TonB
MTERFGVPVLVAATFHVVLLFAIGPSTPDIVIRPPEEQVILRPFSRFVNPPVEEKVDVTEPVAPLDKPGPVKPATEDRSPNVNTDFRTDNFAPPQTQIHVDSGKIEDWGNGKVGKPSLGTPGGPGIFPSSQLDATPRAKVQPAPDYPLALRQAGIEGSVTVEFDVDVAGRVVSARALRSTAREFEDAAVRAVLKWRFEPGRRNGRAVAFRMVVPIGFSLAAD